MSKKSRRGRLKEGTRAFRREVKKPHAIKNVMKAFKQMIDEKAADREAYVQTLFSVWDGAAANLCTDSEIILKNVEFGVEESSFEALLEPYELMKHVYFAPLMDRLDYDEEAAFRECCLRLDCAWQKFFASVLVRYPELSKEVEFVSRVRGILQTEVANMYLGEARAELTPKWYDAYQMCLAGLKAIGSRIGKAPRV